jgi:toluene monooxygenase system ferredoxin subunit
MKIKIKKSEINKNEIIEISKSPKILLIFDGQTYSAFNGMCPHANWPLNNGLIEGHILGCVAHGYEFNYVDGKCVNNPGRNLKMYKIEIDNENIIINF